MIAVYKNNGNYHHLKANDYKTKAEFKQELKANGYKAITVYNNEDIEKIKNKYFTDRTDNEEYLLEVLK